MRTLLQTNLLLTIIYLIFLALLATINVVAQEPLPFLHYKSQQGLMPPAYGPDPNAPRLGAAAASTLTLLKPYTTTTVGSWPRVLAAADFTGDAQTDVALATGFDFDPARDERLHLLTRTGAGLTVTQSLPAGQEPAALLALDFNLDRRIDAALARVDTPALALYAQQPAAGLTGPLALTLPGDPNALAAGDFTNDLRADLAAVVPQKSSIYLRRSSAAGLQPLPVSLPYPTGGYDVLATGDLDNDGDDDLAALRGAGYITDAVVIFLQDGGRFSNSYTLSPETGGAYLPHGLAAGDVNNDGLDDVIVTAGGNVPAAYLNVFLQQEGGLAPTPVVYPAFHLPGPVVIGDLNHDGREDVALLNDAWQTLSVYTQTASGTLTDYATAALPQASRYWPDGLVLADLNGDGGLDVSVAGRRRDLAVLYNTLTAPTAAISQPVFGAVRPPGLFTAAGRADPEAVAVEVRLRGVTAWQPANLVNGVWTIDLAMPAHSGPRRLEARAVDAQGRVQAPPARRRIGVSLESVQINGPTVGAVGRRYEFTATIAPAAATLPLTYTWSPAPAGGQAPAKAAYTWSTPGRRTIKVTVRNAGRPVTATHEIVIKSANLGPVYLPLIVR